MYDSHSSKPMASSNRNTWMFRTEIPNISSNDQTLLVSLSGYSRVAKLKMRWWMETILHRTEETMTENKLF